MNCMRPFCLLCVLVLVSTGAVVSAANPGVATQKPAALPPDPPGPLYLPRRDHERERAPSEEEIQRLLLTMRQNAAAKSESARQAEPVDEFKPISEIPPEDRLPSAPLLVGAYAFVMLAIFAYLVSLSRRLNAVGRDLAKFDSQSKRP